VLDKPNCIVDDIAAEICITATNMLIDLLYRVVDPRIGEVN